MDVDRSIDDLVAQFTPAVDLTGSFRAGDLKIQEWPTIRLDAQYFPTARQIVADVDEHGAFKLERLPPDRFLISIDHLPEGVYVKMIRLGGRDVVGRLDLTSRADTPLEITLSPNAAEIGGTLRDEKGDPLPGGTVHLWAGDDFVAERYVNSAPDGSFRFKNLSPGSYHLAAWDDGTTSFDSELWNTLASQAITVKLSEGSHEIADVKLIVVK